MNRTPSLTGILALVVSMILVPGATRAEQGVGGRPGPMKTATLDGIWSDLFPFPDRRQGSTAIYDPARDRMLVFGGNGSGPTNFGDVWAVALSEPPRWTPIAPSGSPITGRFGHTAIYDPVRDRLIIFGGVDALGSRRNDTWALSLSGEPMWSQLAPSGTPPAGRESHTAIYDPVLDRMIVYGGTDGAMRLGDLWSLSLSGTPEWSQIAPLGTPPSARSSHAAIYDPVRDRMIAFGGNVAFLTDTNETWALSLSGAPAWSHLLPTGALPHAREGHTALYDPIGDRLVVFGGYNTSLESYLNDSWELRLSGVPTWSVLSPSGTPPPERFEHTAILDTTRKRMIVFSGSSEGGLLNDVWSMSLLLPNAWSQLVPYGALPSVRASHSAILDPVRDRMIFFGGYDGAWRNDVWALTLADFPEWSQLAPSGGAPSGRYYATAIHDPVRDRMIVFGGSDDSNTRLNDVWTLSLTGSPAWSQLTTSGTPPSGRVGHTAIYDPVRDRMVVFAGFDGSDRNEVWALSLSETPLWSQLTPTGSLPPARSGHTAIYDPLRDRLIVFAGSFPGPSNDLWSLSLSGSPAWSPITPSGGIPSARSGHAAIFDPVRDRMIVFGGSGGSATNDAWALSLSGGWVQLVPSGPLPPGRYGHSAIYDAERDRQIVFGGAYAGFPHLNDTQALAWDDPVRPVSVCPGDQTWTPGTPLDISYQLTNPVSGDRAIAWTLTSERDWEGFPLRGIEIVGALTTSTFIAHVAIPDTAEVGLNTLKLMTSFAGGAGNDTSCSHRIHDATTSALLSFVSAQAEPGRVRLTWYASDPALTVSVYRTDGGEWKALGQVSPDGTGLIVFEDSQVAAGSRYGYRLGVQQGGKEVFLGETFVEVPRTPGFALGGLRPNPAQRGCVVEFSLPDGSAARLDVLDVAGRRVLSRDVGALGQGSHVVRLQESPTLAPGIYLLRLTRGGHSLSARAVIIQ